MNFLQISKSSKIVVSKNLKDNEKEKRFMEKY